MDGSNLCVSIVNYRTVDHSLACLRHLEAERQTLPGIKVFIADGDSGDGSYEKLAAWVRNEGHEDWISIIALPVNGGFGWAHNQIMSRVLQGPEVPDYIFLLNPDAFVQPGSLRAMVSFMQDHPLAGAAGSRIFDMHGSVQVSAFRFPCLATELADGSGLGALTRLMGHGGLTIAPSEKALQADWVSGSSVMLRSAALRDMGLFDEGFFLYYEEVELMARMKRAGWQIWTNPDCIVRHEGGVSTGVARDAATRRKNGRPRFWYQSHKRLLMLLYGPVRAYGIFVAWLVARNTIFALRYVLSPSFRKHTVHHEMRDKIDVWTSEYGFDRQKAVRQWNDTAGTVPYWLQRPSMRGFIKAEEN